MAIKEPFGTKVEKPANEYLLVSDLRSEVLKSDTDYMSIKKLANIIRKAGGEVTIFKAIKG